MKRCSTTQLREKEIINLCDGLRLGYADDFEFDWKDGHITALLVDHHPSLFCLSKAEQLRIPWEKIECIGEDTVLVRLNPNESPYCEFFKRTTKKSKMI